MQGRTHNPQRRPAPARLSAAALALLATFSAAEAGEAGAKGGGLPVPRFASLKSDRAHVREGPARNHAIAWIFTKRGLPVEIVAEFDVWRRVRDEEGAEGWMFHSLLSGRRTALVAPWVKTGLVDLRRRADARSAVVARLEPKVLVEIAACDGTWCRVNAQPVSGYIRQERLWGVYPNETID